MGEYIFKPLRVLVDADLQDLQDLTFWLRDTKIAELTAQPHREMFPETSQSPKLSKARPDLASDRSYGTAPEESHAPQPGAVGAVSAGAGACGVKTLSASRCGVYAYATRAHVDANLEKVARLKPCFCMCMYCLVSDLLLKSQMPYGHVRS